MGLTPDMTMKELATDEAAKRELTEIILSRGVRGAMHARRVSYDTADHVAEGVSRGVDTGLTHWLEKQQPVKVRNEANPPYGEGQAAGVRP